ncbi:hypothetical protein HY945_04105 [Candidatus Gottesmanbacteria bacterium]|nr:hypothetical protein [Candidatus Gottesmanbacteria bacterium]
MAGTDPVSIDKKYGRQLEIGPLDIESFQKYYSGLGLTEDQLAEAERETHRIPLYMKIHRRTLEIKAEVPKEPIPA